MVGQFVSKVFWVCQTSKTRMCERLAKFAMRAKCSLAGLTRTGRCARGCKEKGFGQSNLVRACVVGVECSLAGLTIHHFSLFGLNIKADQEPLQAQARQVATQKSTVETPRQVFQRNGNFVFRFRRGPRPSWSWRRRPITMINNTSVANIIIF